MLKIQMFRRRPAQDERERLEALHSFLRDELTKELRQAIKLVQTEFFFFESDQPYQNLFDL